MGLKKYKQLKTQEQGNHLMDLLFFEKVSFQKNFRRKLGWTWIKLGKFKVLDLYCGTLRKIGGTLWFGIRSYCVKELITSEFTWNFRRVNSFIDEIPACARYILVTKIRSYIFSWGSNDDVLAVMSLTISLQVAFRVTYRLMVSPDRYRILRCMISQKGVSG